VFGDPNAVGIRMALEGFTTFCKANNADEMWGNGADFDNVILGASYGAIGQRPPWKYSNNRCFRTLKNLIPVDAANELWEKHAKGTHHNALDDAVRQAHIAVDIFKMLRV
jgi:exodeoxyribonuclease VIII